MIPCMRLQLGMQKPLQTMFVGRHGNERLSLFSASISTVRKGAFPNFPGSNTQGAYRKSWRTQPTHASPGEQGVTATETNETLYRRWLGGEEDALRELMERYGAPLTFYINGYIHDIGEAEDLMIEAFSRMIAARPHLYENSFKPYLYKTARHLALRYEHKRRRCSCFSFEELGGEPESGLLVETAVQTKEQNRILHLCMRQLNPEYREALYLFYFENMSHAETVQVMGKTIKQVYNLLERGKKALRPLLEEEGISDTQYR